MKSLKLRHITFFLALHLLVPFGMSAQETVFISSGRTSGRGILQAHDGQCYVLLPKHITDKALNLEDGYNIVAQKGNTATATFRADLGQDLALLKVKTAEGIACPELATIPTTVLEGKLDSLKDMWLLVADEYGETSNIYVKESGKGIGFIDVIPVDPESIIVKGYSGSALMGRTLSGNKVWLGILQDLVPDKNIGSVQLSNVTTILRDNYFEITTVTSIPTPTRTSTQATKPLVRIISSAALGVVGLTLGYQVFHQQSEDIYADYTQYPVPADFLANTTGFSSRQEAFEEAESKRKTSTFFIVGGGLLTAYGAWQFFKKPGRRKTSITLTENGLGLVKNF